MNNQQQQQIPRDQNELEAVVRTYFNAKEEMKGMKQKVDSSARDKKIETERMIIGWLKANNRTDLKISDTKWIVLEERVSDEKLTDDVLLEKYLRFHMDQNVFNLSLAERSKLFVSNTFQSLKHAGASKEGLKVTSKAPQESMMESIIRSAGAEAL